MKIGELETTRSLGKGSMGEVFEAENPRVGTRYAVKVYAYPKDDAEVKARFVQEGRLLAKLNHPRIVKVVDFGEVDGKPYFVMDLVLSPDGAPKSLADVPDGGADEESVGRWYDDVREALAYVHSKGVVHRDLKLQNVLVGPDGHAVLADFGISRVMSPVDEDDGFDPVNTVTRLRDGKKTMMGSIGYMAPEVEMGMPASEKSDWYALGVIVYKLLTGIWCDSRTDVVGTLAGFDPAWTRIVSKLLHSNPAGRECLSWAEEREKDRVAAEVAAEDGVLAERRRGRVARITAWIASAVCVLAVGAGALRNLSEPSRVAEVERRLAEANKLLAIPDFDSLFSVPDWASSNPVNDLPSKEQFEKAKLDAFVITHNDFKLVKGGLGLDHMRDKFKGLRGAAAEEDYDKLFVGLDGGYENSFCEYGALAILFSNAVQRLEREFLKK